MKRASTQSAESRVVRRYNKLYGSLMELVSALQILEPGGTLVDDIVISTREEGKVRLAYISTPVQLTIEDQDRRFILRVIEK
jgi:hypothetical protein